MEKEVTEITSARIIALKARNVKRLIAVEIHPPAGEAVVVVGGENAQGKTSVLDAIMYALAGGKSIPEDVVRHGEKKAVIEVDLGELKVTRVLGKGSKLEVRAASGEKLTSPQAILDKLTGSLTFDPLRFQRLGETGAGRKEQAEILKGLVGLDFSENEKERRISYDRRTEFNRDLKRAEATLESMPYYPDAPKKAIKIADVAEELQAAVEHNTQAQDMETRLGTLKDSIPVLRKQIEEMQANLEYQLAHKITLTAEIKAFEPIDTGALKAKLEDAEVLNERRGKNMQRAELNTQVSDLRKLTGALTETIEEFDSDKQRMLAEAKMPIDGLTFSDDGVIFQDVPFHNCSSAEQLKLSVAMGIAMNPKLKVMLIRDGSLLDDDSLEILRGMAAGAGHQIWLERVGKSEECSVIIQDGTVVGK